MDDASPNPPERRRLSDAERLDWLRLIRSENIGPVTFHQLLAHAGSATAALDLLPDLARRGGRRRAVRICQHGEAEAELAACARLGIRLLGVCEPSYPPALTALPDAPPLISLRGRAELLERDGIAIVGARNASANGRRLAEQMASDLGAAGFLVVSGMARGIDTAAHRGALDSGTLAVVAGGVDIVYPRENQMLYEALLEQGLVIAEMPLGTRPQARHFPRRNRLVSGLCLGVLVVEAAPKSGSLITVGFALEQGREIFAVPGSPLDPRARGCNRLIRQGAILTESAHDVVEALRGPLRRLPAQESGTSLEAPSAGKPPQNEVDEARRVIEELLGANAVAVDELIRQCQLSAAVVNTVLLELELAGRIERHAGNRVAVVYRTAADGG